MSNFFPSQLISASLIQIGLGIYLAVESDKLDYRNTNYSSNNITKTLFLGLPILIITVLALLIVLTAYASKPTLIVDVLLLIFIGTLLLLGVFTLSSYLHLKAVVSDDSTIPSDQKPPGSMIISGIILGSSLIGMGSFVLTLFIVRATSKKGAGCVKCCK